MPTSMQISEQGLVHIAPETKREDYTLDIIAVPGLAASPKDSFISETNKFDWLRNEREGILSDFPEARVLKYQYDSRWYGGKALKQTLGNVAELLLDSLVAERKGHDTRPIIFVAHSMGGLVVAKALTLAVSQPENIDRMRIYECFAGGVFFGTPFGGSAEVARGYMLAHLFEHVKMAVPSQMLQVLDPERDSLIELRRDFAQLVKKEPAASIACIYEQKETNYMGEKFGQLLQNKVVPTKVRPSALVVTEKSATLDGADFVRGFACDHRQLNRFESAKDKDGRYVVVKELLKNIESKARLVVKRRLNASKRSIVDDATFARLADSLNIVPFQRKRKNLESASGNSKWIVEEPKFLEWRDQNDESNEKICLWVSGSEGLGKSKAALAAVENLEAVEKKQLRDESEVMVVYFFCDNTADSQSAENLVKSLMWQMILKRRSLAQYVRGFAAPENAQSVSAQSSISFAKLWRGLQDMLRDDSAPNVYFVVNNLHYLSSNEPSTDEFLQNIKDLLEGSDTVDDPIKKNSKWMFLSRARDNIRNILQETEVRINLEDGSKDKELRQMLKVFTQERVKELAEKMNYSLALQYFVNSILVKRAENNKLWIEVVCCLLEALPSDHVTVRKTLEGLPQSVKELMNRVWAESLKSDVKNIDRTKEILRTLAIVYEDPTLDELKVLAELDGTDIYEQVRACGPLLRIYEDCVSEDLGSSRVTFIHEEAKDALLREKSSRKLIGLSDDGDDQTEVQWQHGILALRSFSYTMEELNEDDSIDWTISEPTDDKDPDPELKQLFPDSEAKEENDDEDEDIASLEYPVKYWLRHGYDATPKFVDTLDLKDAFWALESTARRRWWSSYARRDDNVDGELKSLTAMHIAAYFGLTPLINSLLVQGHSNEINIRDSWDNQPLHWAASRGHVEAMEKLLLNKADINDGEKDQVWTPLHMAASSGQIEAMKLLMSGHYGRANLDAVDKDVGTALTLALSYNQAKAVELLLDSGASPTLTASDGESPMAVAAYTGQEDLFDMLWEKGAGHNLSSARFGSAIAAAASAGYISIVKKLLRYSNELSLQGALEEAARHGFRDVVQLLLQSSKYLKCDEAFQTAASLGNDPVLEELWNHNEIHNGTAVSQNAVNNALYMATDNEQDTTVDLLLQKYHADPNAHGPEYGNAVTASAYDGTITILSSLVRFGANVNDPAGYPLQAASSQGHLDVVKFLLANHASVNAHSPIFPDGTALQAACVARQNEVAKELLERGANPNLGGGKMTNPITAATSNGLGDLVKLLLQKGANPNVFGGEDGSTPLINAACNLEAGYLDAMIKSGARVDTADPDEDTALILSAYYGDNDCVKLLLAHGANVNFCGKNRGTALHAAASMGYNETCRLLLKYAANPTIRGGSYDTVIQAAATSGNADCMKVLLGENTDIKGLQFWKDKIDVNVQGGEYFTALHAAAVNDDAGCLRLLLDRKPKLDVVPRKKPEIGTPLYAAAFAGCSLNARILLEAGANPNIGTGKSGTVLQVAALKCCSELCDLLIEHGAKVNEWSGKYGSALVAAVVKDYHEQDTDVLEFLLDKDFTPQAYRAALDKAFILQRRDAFKLIWQSIKSKGPKKLKLSTKQLLPVFQSRIRKWTDAGVKAEDANSDFGDDVVNNYQDFEDCEDDDDDDAGDNDDAKKKEEPANGNVTRSVDASGTANENSSSNNGSREISGGLASDTADGNPGEDATGSAETDEGKDNQTRELDAGDDAVATNQITYNDRNGDDDGAANREIDPNDKGEAGKVPETEPENTEDQDENSEGQDKGNENENENENEGDGGEGDGDGDADNGNEQEPEPEDHDADADAENGDNDNEDDNGNPSENQGDGDDNAGDQYDNQNDDGQNEGDQNDGGGDDDY